MYQYDGLYIHALACKYDTFMGNDIWVNFRCKFNSISDYNYANSIIFFGPYINTEGYSYIIDEKIYTDSNAQLNGWTMLPPFQYMDRYTISQRSTLNLSSNYSVAKGIQVGSLNTLTDFNNFNIHIVDNTFNYYMNGNYLGSRSGTHYKGFVICYGIGDSSLATTCSQCTIQSITLTDKMSLEVPKPPYTLYEKDNEVYSYKKEV